MRSHRSTPATPSHLSLRRKTSSSCSRSLSVRCSPPLCKSRLAAADRSLSGSALCATGGGASEAGAREPRYLTAEGIKVRRVRNPAISSPSASRNRKEERRFRRLRLAKLSQPHKVPESSSRALDRKILTHSASEENR